MSQKIRRHAAIYAVDTTIQNEPKYYFAPADRAPGPYKQRRRVKAVIDIADDGTLAGIELIDDMPPPPK